MITDDRFKKQFPVEFNDEAASIWDHAIEIALNTRNEKNRVTPLDYFTSWLELKKEAPHGLTSYKFSQTWNEYIIFSKGHTKPANPLTVENTLADAFSFALADSYRFEDKINDVSYKWIIPNLFNNRCGIKLLLKRYGLDVSQFLADTLLVLGLKEYQYRMHYDLRYMPINTSAALKTAKEIGISEVGIGCEEKTHEQSVNNKNA